MRAHVGWRTGLLATRPQVGDQAWRQRESHTDNRADRAEHLPQQKLCIGRGRPHFLCRRLGLRALADESLGLALSSLPRLALSASSPELSLDD